MKGHSYKVEIPDHELIRPIGQGSYGEIWIARNIMGTFRAVKVIHRKSFKDDRPYLRELEGIKSFEPISRTHEGFIHVLQIGINQDHAYFYYIMEIGDDKETGQTIQPDSYVPRTLAHDLMEQDRLSYQDCLYLGLALSDALMKLHRHGLVHRDIKPSNIIFVEGQPKLADIGLVTVIREELSLVGTDGFIPPEGPGTPQGDIYSLGKVLYEISTGKDRFQFPELPTLLEDLPDREQFLELNEVILSACHVDPLKRYKSADSMHADLAALQGGKSLRKIKNLENRIRKLKKTAITGLLVLSFLFGALFLYQKNKSQQAEILQAKVINKTSAGNQFLNFGEYAYALEEFLEALKLDPDTSARADLNRLRIGTTLSQMPKLTALMFADMELNGIDWIPERDTLLSAADDGHVMVWDIDSQSPVHSLRAHEGSIKSACFGNHGLRLFTAGSDGFIKAWDSKTGRNLGSFRHGSEIRDLAIHQEGERLFASGSDGRLLSFDVQAGLELLRITEPLFQGKGARSLALANSGNRLAVGGDNGVILVLGTQDLEPLFKFDFHRDLEIHSVAFSQSEDRIIVGSSDHDCRIISMQSGEIQNLLPHEDRVVKAKFSPDDRYALTVCFDGFARLWNLRDNRLVLPLLHHSLTVIDARFDQTGRQILTACKDGTIRLWDLAGRKLPATLRDNRLPGESFRSWIKRNQTQTDLENPPLTDTTIYWEAECYARVTSQTDGVHVYYSDFSTADSREFVLDINRFFHGRRDWLERGLDFLDISGSGLLAGVPGGYVVMGHAAGPGKEEVRETPFSEYFRGGWSRDVKWILLAGWNPSTGRHEVWVIDPETGELRYPPLSHEFSIRSFTLSHDGKRLAVYCSDMDLFGRPIYIWDFETGNQSTAPLYHLDGIYSVSFSPDDRLLISASEDDTAIIRDPDSGDIIGLPLQHYDHVFAAEISSDSRILFSARWNTDSVRLWEASTGMPLSPWIPHWYIPTHIQYLEEIEMLVASAPARKPHSGMHFVWKVEKEQASIEVLSAMIRILAGPDIQNAGSDPATHVMSIKKAWEYLQGQQPSLFRTEPSAVIAWHLREADECQYRYGEKDYRGAAFHLRELIKLAPEKAGLRNRLREVESLGAGSDG